MDFRSLFARLGHVGTSIVITVGSILASVTIVLLAMVLFDIEFSWIHFSFSIIIPAIITPAISWYFLKLYFKLEKLETKMRYLATYDTLTGFLTRKAFFDKGNLLIEKEKGYQSNMIVLYIDIDNFKHINDRFGHDGGDRVLSYVGETLLATFRKSDLIGRLGGEEIAIILSDIELGSVINIIKRLQEVFSDTKILLNGEHINFTVSIGVSIMKEDIPLAKVLHYADQALYKAKQNGKDCTYLYKGENQYEILVPSK